MTAHNTIRFEGIWGYPSCKAKFDAAPPSPERHWSRRLRSHGHSLKVPEPSEDWWKGWNFQLYNHLCRMDQLLCILLRYGLWTNFSSRSHIYTSCDAEGCTQDCGFRSLAGSVPALVCETLTRQETPHLRVGSILGQFQRISEICIVLKVIFEESQWIIDLKMSQTHLNQTQSVRIDDSYLQMIFLYFPRKNIYHCHFVDFPAGSQWSFVRAQFHIETSIIFDLLRVAFGQAN